MRQLTIAASLVLIGMFFANGALAGHGDNLGGAEDIDWEFHGGATDYYFEVMQPSRDAYSQVLTLQAEAKIKNLPNAKKIVRAARYMATEVTAGATEVAHILNVMFELIQAPEFADEGNLKNDLNDELVKARVNLTGPRNLVLIAYVNLLEKYHDIYPGVVQTAALKLENVAKYDSLTRSRRLATLAFVAFSGDSEKARNLLEYEAALDGQQVFTAYYYGLPNYRFRTGRNADGEGLVEIRQYGVLTDIKISEPWGFQFGADVDDVRARPQFQTAEMVLTEGEVPEKIETFASELSSRLDELIAVYSNPKSIKGQRRINQIISQLNERVERNYQWIRGYAVVEVGPGNRERLLLGGRQYCEAQGSSLDRQCRNAIEYEKGVAIVKAQLDGQEVASPILDRLLSLKDSLSRIDVARGKFGIFGTGDQGSLANGVTTILSDNTRAMADALLSDFSTIERLNFREILDRVEEMDIDLNSYSHRSDTAYILWDQMEKEI